MGSATNILISDHVLPHDDILIRGSTPATAMSLMLNLLPAQGFIVNVKKSSLILSTKILVTHLGVDIDTLIAKIYPFLALSANEDSYLLLLF